MSYDGTPFYTTEGNTIRIKFVGVLPHVRRAGRVEFPRCDELDCFARPDHSVIVSRKVGTGEEVICAATLCRHHAEEVEKHRKA